MKVVQVTVRYLVRLLKLWIIWFWFLALDGLGLIVDTFAPGFSPPRWLYWVIPAVGFVIANIKLFAEMESEIQALQSHIADLLDAKAKLTPAFALGGKKLSDHIVLPTRSAKHIQVEELAKWFASFEGHLEYLLSQGFPGNFEAKKTEIIEKGFIPLRFVITNTGNATTRNIRLHLDFPKECMLICGLFDWPSAHDRTAIGPVPVESAESNRVYYHICDEIISGLSRELYNPLYVLFPQATFRKEREVVTVHWKIFAAGTEPQQGELTILLVGTDEMRRLFNTNASIGNREKNVLDSDSFS